MSSAVTPNTERALGLNGNPELTPSGLSHIAARLAGQLPEEAAQGDGVRRLLLPLLQRQRIAVRLCVLHRVVNEDTFGTILGTGHPTKQNGSGIVGGRPEVQEEGRSSLALRARI